MKKCWYVVLAAILLLIVAPLFSPRVQASWDPIEEKGDSTYEIVPALSKVSVTVTYHIRNVDYSTSDRRSYYYQYYILLPREAQTISVSGHAFLLHGQFVPSGTLLNRHTLTLSKQLFYLDEADFTVKYDLFGASKSVFEFRAYAHTNSGTLRILVPKGYSTEINLSKLGYREEETFGHRAYVYTIYQESNLIFTTWVSAVCKSRSLTLQDTIYSSRKKIPITVEYWEGEEKEAKYILNLYAKAIPILEDIIGVPFPPDYPILVTKGTLKETGGFAGYNAGSRGIQILAYSISDNDTLVHELVHYWARKPPFSETWMIEGLASFYTYLALEKLGYGEEAQESRKSLFRYYDDYIAYIKGRDPRYEEFLYTPLPDVTIPSSQTTENKREISYAYGRSFAFLYKLYERVGLPPLQKLNQEAFTMSRPLDWLDLLIITEKVTGQKISPLFAGSVLPGVANTSGKAYQVWTNTWETFCKAEQAVSANKGKAGVEPLERGLLLAHNSILNSKYEEATRQSQSVLGLYESWQAAQKAYQNVSKAISLNKGKIGIEAVEKSLVQAQDLMSKGNYDDATRQTQAALTLLGTWQTAHKSYQDTDQAISVFKGKMGLEPVEKVFMQARNQMANGNYQQAITQAQASLKLLESWKLAHTVYQDTEQAISANKGKIGIQAVEKALALAQDLMSKGNYDDATSQIRATLKLLESWKLAHTVYQDTEQAISANKGKIGIQTVEKALALARDFIVKGDYEDAGRQTQAALKLLDDRDTADKAYQEAKQALSIIEGKVGFSNVERTLLQSRELLANGNYTDATKQSRITIDKLKDWREAQTAYQEAEVAVLKASQEGRTSKLEDAKKSLTRSYEMISNGQFQDAAVLARLVYRKAEDSMTPFRAMVPWFVTSALSLATIGAIYILRRNHRAAS